MNRLRTPILAGNWKLYKTGAEGAEFVEQLARRLGCACNAEIVVAPPFTSLYQVARAAGRYGIQVAAQDVFWKEEGPYTGEVAPHMIRDVGAEWVIVGHSERRQHFGETNESVARKIRAALDGGLRPIACVGETEQERLQGKTEEVLRTQVSVGLSEAKSEEVGSIAVAYEPVWAIGTGRTATREQAEEACAFIRALVAELFGEEAAASVRILYGGSVKPENAVALLGQSNIDGGLVGGASLEVESFAGIIEQCCTP